jgi:uncharacterized membrane protein YiaA
MPTKVSEKKLFFSVVLLTGAIMFLLNANLFNAPVRISEKGIAFVFAGIVLLTISIRLLRKAVVKV